LTLSDRTFVCPECGLVIDRDLNAALNIKNEGTRIIGLRQPEFTLVDDLNKEEILCGGRLKQEEENLQTIAVPLPKSHCQQIN
jgi:transposase